MKHKYLPGRVKACLERVADISKVKVADLSVRAADCLLRVADPSVAADPSVRAADPSV